VGSGRRCAGGPLGGTALRKLIGCRLAGWQ
jgi:hypothetical protein